MSLRSTVNALAALLVGTASASCIALCTQWLLTQSLELAPYGKLAALLAAVNLATPVATAGLNWFWLQAFGREGSAAYRWMPASMRVFWLAFGLSLVGLALYVGVSEGATWVAWLLLFLGSAFVLSGQAFVELGSARLQLEERYFGLSWWQMATPVGRFTSLAMLTLLGWASFTNILLAFAAVGLVISLLGYRHLSAVRGGAMRLKGHVPGTTPPPADADFITTLRESYPFALITIFYLIYFQSVILLIELLLEPEFAGLFNAALIVIAAVNLLPNVLFQKFLVPKLCRWAEHDPATLNLVTNISAAMLSLVGLLVLIALVLLAVPIVTLLFGSKFAGAAPVLAGLAFTVPLRFIQSAYSAVYIDRWQMSTKVRYAGLAALLSFTLNILLLPQYGLQGAVIAAIASEAALLLLHVIGLKRHVPAVDAALALKPLTMWRAVTGKLAKTG